MFNPMTLLAASAAPPEVHYLTTQITANAIVIGIIQYLKQKEWVPFINDHSTTLNRTLSAVGAGLSALGVHISWSHDLGVLMISGLTLSTISTFAWAAIKNFAWQEMIYKGIVKNGNGQPAPVPHP